MRPCLAAAAYCTGSRRLCGGPDDSKNFRQGRAFIASKGRCSSAHVQQGPAKTETNGQFY